MNSEIKKNQIPFTVEKKKEIAKKQVATRIKNDNVQKGKNITIGKEEDLGNVLLTQISRMEKFSFAKR